MSWWFLVSVLAIISVLVCLVVRPSEEGTGIYPKPNAIEELLVYVSNNLNSLDVRYNLGSNAGYITVGDVVITVYTKYAGHCVYIDDADASALGARYEYVKWLSDKLGSKLEEQRAKEQAESLAKYHKKAEDILESIKGNGD